MADSQKYVETNVFDINNPNVLNGYIDSSGNYVPYATNGTLYVPITAGTSYTVSGIIRASQSTVVRIATFTNIPSTQTPSVNLYTLNQGDSITITAGNNENYLFVMFCGDSDYNAYGSVHAALTTNCANLHIDTYAWQHSLRKLTTATEAIENPLYSDGTAITAYTIKGNEEHTGTPSPQNPVMPQGVGEMSSNMINYQLLFSNNPIKETDAFRYYRLSVKPNTQYTLKSNAPSTTTPSAQTTFLYGDSDTMTTANNGVYSDIANTVTSTVEGYIFVAIRKYYQYITAPTETDFANGTYTIMINEGSTALPYEPYGQYKIPISSGQTVNNYLGSIQSTRQIQKLVLTGQEDWLKSGRYSGSFYARILAGAKNPSNSDFQLLCCTHAEYVFPINDTNYVYGKCAIDGSPEAAALNLNLFIGEAAWSADDFKTYLQQQYAAGTPVTVWYVLATPTTGIVNEPLMKIGTYADSISNGAAIQTTEGANSITVDTTVQPSEFTATWAGWHDAYVKEKSENLFDYTTMSSGLTGYYLDSGGNEVSNNTWSITDYIPCDGQAFTLGKIGGNTPAICLYDSAKSYITGQTYNTGGASIKSDITVTATQTAKYIRFSYLNAAGGSAKDDLSTIMLNSGSTALPYEPYWK